MVEACSVADSSLQAWLCLLALQPGENFSLLSQNSLILNISLELEPKGVVRTK